MNINDMALVITGIEGKRKAISIAQVKEVIGIVADLIWQDEANLKTFLAYGHRRSKRKKGKR